MRRAGWAIGLLSACGLVQAAAPAISLLTEEGPPFTFRLPSGHPGGVLVDVMQELFRRSEVPVTLALLAWARSLSMAATENDTCVFATVRTPEREHQFKWVGPLMVSSWVLYAGPKSPANVRTLEAARPWLIGDYLGNAEGKYLAARGFRVDFGPSVDVNLRKLMAGHIDFWATSKYMGAYLVHQNKLPALHPVVEFNAVPVFLACNTGVPDDLIQRLNERVAGMVRDGTIDRIRRGYLGS